MQRLQLGRINAPPLETPETFKLLVDANLSSVHGPDATGCCESIGGRAQNPGTGLRSLNTKIEIPSFNCAYILCYIEMSLVIFYNVHLI
ncbi:MAG: hypothetical protein SCG81_01670 [Nitrosomonadaceae bacterium]|nr:hypothetical protein [Nitrosomonadaceae bacterium]